MGREAILIENLKSCVSDWDAFDIDVEQEEGHNDWFYFAVIITHDTLNVAHDFTARVDSKGNCEMDYSEGCWSDINMGNLFAWMWFDSVLTHHRGIDDI